MADILARMKLRTGTFAAWTSANPILAAGEPGYEVDTAVLRIGDGSTAFLSLERFQTSDGFAATFQPLADNLTAFSGLTFAANKLPYGTGIGSFALADLTAEARAFLALATKAAQRDSLGLTSAAITPVDASTNMTLNPTQLPSRAAVGGAILVTGGPAKRVLFTASGTFVKADHGAYPADHLVLIEAWGGGGGGAAGVNQGGGGGASYRARHMRFTDIPTTVTVTIGAGGSVGASGGNTLVGTLLTAGGGGAASADGGTGGILGQGDGGAANISIGGAGLAGGWATGLWGGGGGGGGGGSGANGTGGNGGLATFGGGGGGGGGGAVAGSGGTSVYGGNGGASGAAGTAPGGGGGRNAAGARGEVRIWL